MIKYQRCSFSFRFSYQIYRKRILEFSYHPDSVAVVSVWTWENCGKVKFVRGNSVLFISFTLQKLYVVVYWGTRKSSMWMPKMFSWSCARNWWKLFSMRFSYVPATVPMCLFAHTEGFCCIRKFLSISSNGDC